MAALNDLFWFCVSSATHLFSKASSERRVYNGSMYGKMMVEACSLWFMLKNVDRKMEAVFCICTTTLSSIQNLCRPIGSLL